MWAVWWQHSLTIAPGTEGDEWVARVASEKGKGEGAEYLKPVEVVSAAQTSGQLLVSRELPPLPDKVTWSEAL